MRSLTGFNSDSANGAFAPGQPIYASTLNSMATCADKSRTMPSNDLVFNAGVGGTAYSLGQQVYYGNAAPPPLNPRLDNDKITVYPGTVNRIVPKIEDDYLDASTPPSITVTGEGYICIKLTYVSSTFFPRTAEIIFFEGSVTPADTETEGYYPLSKINSVTVDEVTTYSQIVLSYGNFVCNRLKSGANPAAWYWATITPQPGA